MTMFPEPSGATLMQFPRGSDVEPVIVTFEAATLTGAMPAYTSGVPSTTIVPVWALVGSCSIELRWPSTLTVPVLLVPPSTLPDTEPPGSTSKVLTLVGAPTSVPKFVKVTPPAVPLSAPVTVQVVVPPAGPFSVFEPAPPSKAIEMPAEPSEESMVNESSPLPPVTVRAETDEIACDCDVPSIVTEISVPVTAAEIVCEEPSDAVTFHAAGGARPLAVHVAGSGAAPSVTLVPLVAPSDCVAGVVPVAVPPVEPEEVPQPPVVPVTPCVAGSVPVTSAPDPVETVPAVSVGVESVDGVTHGRDDGAAVARRAHRACRRGRVAGERALGNRAGVAGTHKGGRRLLGRRRARECPVRNPT